MPPPRKELAKWASQQRASERSEQSFTNMMQAAHSTGSLNLSNRMMEAVPDLLMKYKEVVCPQENWWEIQELKKLDFSHNLLEGCLSEELFAQFSELEVWFFKVLEALFVSFEILFFNPFTIAATRMCGSAQGIIMCTNEYRHMLTLIACMHGPAPD